MTYPVEKGDMAPIFVVGAPRSGTTLIASIIGRHRDIFSPGESHYFEDIWTRRKEVGKLIHQSEISLAAARILTLFGRFNFPQTQKMVDAKIKKKELVEETHNLGGGYGILYYTFMSKLAKIAGKRRFCDDTPKNLYYLDTIFDFFPDAKVIGCVRDPRDFLCSYKNYWKVTSAAESARVKALYHPLLTSLLWRSSSNLLLKHVNQCCHYRLLLVQYEKLVEDPVEEVSRICGFLEINCSDDLIQVETHNSSFEQSSPGIFTTSIERWRTELSPEEIWWVQRMGKNNMLALGYETENVSPSKRVLFLTVMSAPLAFIKALYVNNRRRGPLLGYVLRRLSTLLKQ